MFDTHCHLTFPELHGRLEDVISQARAAGVSRMVTIGTTPSDARNACALAERFDGVYFSAGVHPHYSPDVPMHELPSLAEIAAHPRCVAFGEMGVDYHYNEPPPKTQHEYFAAQLEVVRYAQSPKPVIIHCRKAVDDTLAIIRASGLAGSRFVFHCFTEPPEEVRKVLDLGAMVGFTGIVTYKNAAEVSESAKLVPSDRILVETDAPFLTPEPHRRVKPNEPKYVMDTARFLAELRGCRFDEFEQQTDSNARRIFRL